MKKKLPMILMILSLYLFFILPYFYSTNASFSVTSTKILGIFILLLYLFNLIYPFILKKQNTEEKDFLWISMIAKISLIPIFLLMFIVCMGLALVPGLILFVPFIIIIEYFLIIVSSFYGINGILLSYRNKKISTFACTVNIILHLIFVLDVFSSIYMYFKIRKK